MGLRNLEVMVLDLHNRFDEVHVCALNSTPFDLSSPDFPEMLSNIMCPPGLLAT